MIACEMLDKCGEFPVFHSILDLGPLEPEDDQVLLLVQYQRPSLVDRDVARRMESLCTFEAA